MIDRRRTFDLTATQTAYLRTMLFRELNDSAETLGDQAHEAHENGGDIIGRDARGTYYQTLGPVAELLDIFGWDVAGDLKLVIAAEAERR